MSLDTIAGIMSGRRQELIWSLGALNTAVGSADRPDSFGFLDDDIPLAAPGTAAGEFPTTYWGVPALTAPARVIGLTCWSDGGNRRTATLLDRLWISGTMTGTGGTINSGNMPARSSDGEGYQLYICFRTAASFLSSALPITVTYTNSAGTGGRTASTIVIPGGSMLNGTLPAYLQTGDTGVKSVESVSFPDMSGGGAGDGVQVMVARKIATETVMQREITQASSEGLVMQRKRGRLLSLISPILPTGTVITPTVWGTSTSAGTFLMTATLAYG